MILETNSVWGIISLPREFGLELLEIALVSVQVFAIQGGVQGKRVSQSSRESSQF